MRERDGESRRRFFFFPLLTSYLKAKFESGLSGDLISFMAGRLSLSPCHGPFFFSRFPKIKILWEYKLPLKQLA